MIYKGKKFIFLILILCSFTYADDIIKRLDSPDYGVRMQAVIEIRDNKLKEYSEALADRVWIQPMLSLKYFFIKALFILQYENVEEFLLRLINEINNEELPPYEQPLYYKVSATELLVKLNNLTTVDYVFEYVSIDTAKNGQQIVSLLKDIALKIPKHSQKIKDFLISIKNNSEFSRLEALKYLILLFGENNLKDELLFSIVNDPDSDIRKYAMEHYNFSDKKDLLKQQIQNDDSWFLRIKYTEDYLKNFTKPEDLKFIIDYLPLETDTNARNGIENRIYGFIPLKFENMNYLDWAEELLENLSVIYKYSWLEEKEYDYYKKTMSGLFLLFEKKDTIASCEALTEIKENVINDFDNKRISGEAYSFIFFKASYIQETLPWVCN